MQKKHSIIMPFSYAFFDAFFYAKSVEFLCIFYAFFHAFFHAFSHFFMHFCMRFCVRFCMHFACVFTCVFFMHFVMRFRTTFNQSLQLTAARARKANAGGKPTKHFTRTFPAVFAMFLKKLVSCVFLDIEIFRNSPRQSSIARRG